MILVSDMVLWCHSTLKLWTVGESDIFRLPLGGLKLPFTLHTHMSPWSVWLLCLKGFSLSLLTIYFLLKTGYKWSLCHCRMNWTWQIRTERPCLLYQTRRNGRSTAARRRWVVFCTLSCISSDLPLASCWLAAWTHNLELNFSHECYWKQPLTVWNQLNHTTRPLSSS